MSFFYGVAKTPVLVIATSLAGIGTAAFGADVPPAQVEEIEVVARRLDIARQAIQPGLGANQFQFDHDALARNPKGLDLPFDQLLLQAPGVTQDSDGEVHIRNEHANVQYRLNGIVLPQGSDSFGNLIDTAVADKVVVLTGALPAQYGFRTAGVVDITTPMGAFASKNEIGLRGGAYDHHEIRGLTAGSNGGFNYFLTGRYLEDEQGISSPTGATDPVHNQTQQYRGFGYFSQILDQHLRLSATIGAYDGNYQLPNVPGVPGAYNYGGGTTFDSLALDQRQRESSYFATMALQGSYGDFDFLLAPFVRTSMVHFNPDIAGDLILNGGADRTYLQNHTVGVQMDSSYRINNDHSLRFGVTAEMRRTRAQLDSLVFPADSQGNQSSTMPISVFGLQNKTGSLFGIYAQDEWGLRDDLTLNFGARFDQLDAYSDESQLSPRISLTYHITESTDMHAGYARAFTPPEQEATSRVVALFVGTVRAPEVLQNDPAKAEREHNFDMGVTQNLGGGFSVGLDGYYKLKRNLLDEGQFGESTTNSPFNYAQGNVYGIEMSSGFTAGSFSSYANIAYGREKGRNIVTGQIFLGREELDYIANHYILTDHSQTWSGAGGASWRIDHPWGALTTSGDFLFGSGLRKAPDGGGLPPNGSHLPAYTQINVGLSQTFAGAGFLDETTISVDMENLLDKVYLIRDGSGVGTGAPKYGPRRAVYFGLSRKF